MYFCNSICSVCISFLYINTQDRKRRHDELVITTAQLHSTNTEPRFYAGSNPIYRASKL